MLLDVLLLFVFSFHFSWGGGGEHEEKLVESQQSKEFVQKGDLNTTETEREKD